MKFIYYLILLALFLIFGIFIWLLRGYLKFSDWINTFTTLMATCAALAAGIIALGIANKSPHIVKFTVKMEVDKQNIQKYNPADLPDELRKGSGNKPFHSYRVYFKIKNQSKFTLKRPVITFRLPADLTHPDKNDKGNWISCFHSNFFNVRIDLRSFQYEETIVLSNTILPYLNDDQELPIWIRMCLMEDDKKPRHVYIDLNCDNAEGETKEVIIIPKKFLNDIG